ncbi:MAG: hypothetical protein MUF52_09690 [Syntrophobacteraceae bacterium]|jgi:hypothetical protein|nr:hypothetical protein [Syntrophobacteraceae bacterium]
MSYSEDNETLETLLAEDAPKTGGGPSGKTARRVAAAESRESHDRLDKLYRTIRTLMDSKFTGYVKMNFTQGTLGRVEKFEEILKK